jgi:carbon monoxide dehydrogenase subunit G
MDMTGERRIAASRGKVWDALNDPVVLKASIPGCETLEKQSDTAMKAIAVVKVGPMTGRFSGNVQLADLDPPNGYTISGEGQGGVLGFAKGGAKVRLSDDGAGTLLAYEVHAQVGGKMAQLGARLIDASAKQMADAFFDRFSAQLAPPVVAFPAEAVAPRPLPPSAIGISALVPREPFGLPMVAWIGGALYLVILILILGSLL